jgi:hypothetical protein
VAEMEPIPALAVGSAQKLELARLRVQMARAR